MDDEKLYGYLIATNNAEQQTYWTRYNIQAVVNVAALSAYAVVFKSEDQLPTRFFVVALPIVGLALAVIWCQMTVAGGRWMDFWQNRLRDVEGKWPDDCKLPRSFKAAKKVARRRPAMAPSVRTIALALPGLMFLTWLAFEIAAWTSFVPR